MTNESIQFERKKSKSMRDVVLSARSWCDVLDDLELLNMIRHLVFLNHIEIPEIILSQYPSIKEWLDNGD